MADARVGPRHEGSVLRDYAHVLLRRKWIVLPVLVCAPLVAVLLTLRQPSEYEATAEVLLSRQNLASSLTGVADPTLSQPAERFTQTQAELARVPEVASRTLSGAGVSDELSVGAFLEDSSVSAKANADILEFTVRAEDPDLAAALATGYATQFTLFRRELDTRALRNALQELDERTAALEATGDRGSALYKSLVDKQQQLETIEALQTSNAFVVRPTDSASQVAPRPVRNGVLGLVLGVVAGVVLAFIVEGFDTRPRTAAEMARRLGLPLLARIPGPRGRLKRRGDLVTLAAPGGAEAEAFRMLRTNLELVNMRHNARTIMVTSALNGEGKSTTAANLAVALANDGRRVLLVDFDLRRPAQARLFGLNDKAPRFFAVKQPRGLVDVMLGRTSLDRAIRRIPLSPLTSNSGADEVSTDDVLAMGNGVPERQLELLPAGVVPTNAGQFIGATTLGSLLEALAQRAEIVLVDSPPLLQVGDGLEISRHVDAMMIVCRISLERRSIVSEMRRVLETSPAVKLGFVLTDTEATADYGDAYGGFEQTTYRAAKTSAS